MTYTPKPMKGEATKARAKRSRTKRAMQSVAREQCFHRDKGRCRACYTNGLTLDFTGNPFSVFQAHHVIYRSRGGKDDLSNLIGTCYDCHEALHQRHISVTGNPNGTVVFREYDRLTRELIRKWESDL